MIIDAPRYIPDLKKDDKQSNNSKKKTIELTDDNADELMKMMLRASGGR